MFRVFFSIANRYLAWTMGSGGKGRILLRFPFALNSGWYKEQPCTRFRTFQHRKERKGFRHEFIVLMLLDGSVCRIERVGDPDTRLDALTPQGSAAYDMAQCFRPEDMDHACLGTSDIIAEVTLPYEFDIKDVLMICQAIHEGKTRFTLQVYNCYFFSLAIQACLTRLVIQWGDEKRLGIWLSHVNRGIEALPVHLSELPVSPPRPHVLFRLYAALNASSEHPRSSLTEEIRLKLQRRITDHTERVQRGISSRINHVLWYREVGSIPAQFIKENIKGAIVDVFMERLTQTHSGESPTREDLVTQLLLALVELLATADGIEHRSLDQPQSPIPNRLGSPGSNVTHEVHIPNPRTVDWYRFGSLLLDAPFRTLGVPLFTSEMDAIPCIIIDDKLRDLEIEVESLGTIGDSDLRRLIKEIRALIGNRAAIWGRDPGADVWDYIEKYIPDHIPDAEDMALDGAMLQVKEEYSEPRYIKISTFQKHLLSRIRGHGEEIEKHWLGTSGAIELELRDTLSRIWGSICEQASIGATFNPQERRSDTPRQDDRCKHNASDQTEQTSPSSSVLPIPSLDNITSSSLTPGSLSHVVKNPKAIARGIKKIIKSARPRRSPAKTHPIPPPEQAETEHPITSYTLNTAPAALDFVTSFASFAPPFIPLVTGISTLSGEILEIIGMTQAPESSKCRLDKFEKQVNMINSLLICALQREEFAQQTQIKVCLETVRGDVNDILNDISHINSSKGMKRHIKRALMSAEEDLPQMRRRLKDALLPLQPLHLLNASIDRFLLESIAHSQQPTRAGWQFLLIGQPPAN
ncbi:unnamed protein product [Rhizoctonia solani]|uniref:Uncharacterized protein n=1 Tax=Rhizoctonia solani TaxID=456999 RepID=A0A8H3AKW9_9AGAM|nr:unnamed protein product [Rhizoctonia solani]